VRGEYGDVVSVQSHMPADRATQAPMVKRMVFQSRFGGYTRSLWRVLGMIVRLRSCWISAAQTGDIYQFQFQLWRTASDGWKCDRKCGTIMAGSTLRVYDRPVKRMSEALKLAICEQV
jgi:hypothetical protein